MEDSNQKENPVQNQYDMIVRDSTVPKLYANSFILNIGSSDFALVALLNGQPLQVMNVSYTSMKSLSEIIDRQIKLFEDKTQIQILTSKQIKEAVHGVKTEDKPEEKPKNNT